MSKMNKKEYEVLKELDDKWKWIARDKDGVLGVYDAKVVKTKFHNFWIMAIKKKIDSTLFSFIQWEDEEPYNIPELIKEYEFGKILLAMAKEETVLEFKLESEETKEKQKYYAKIKGHELLSDSVDGCWNVDGKELYIDTDWHDYSGYKTTILTKDEWIKLGINEDNADFLLVEELEE